MRLPISCAALILAATACSNDATHAVTNAVPASLLQSSSRAAASTALRVPAAQGEAPAARVGDIAVLAPDPPATIFPPGASTVLVCGEPDARVGDSALFQDPGPPPTAHSYPIVIGSATVIVGGAPAARQGDTFENGAFLTEGCATVLIGS